MKQIGFATDEAPVGALLSSCVEFHKGPNDLFIADGSRCMGQETLVKYPGTAYRTTNVLMWEHSDLLKLKAAVEKALEVTPKPPKFSTSRADISCAWEIWMETNGGLKGTVGQFNGQKLAEEYVAWKNAQEGK